MYTNIKSKGVYVLVNKINHRIYIGSAASKLGFHGRLTKHRYALRQGKHHSPILQKDYERYGFDAFEFIVLHECETREECEQLEQFWLDIIGVGSENGSYNICTKAGIAPSPKGRKDSPETIAKRVASNKANPWTPEMKLRAAQALAKANSKCYVVTSLEGVESEIENLAQFCRENRLLATGMINVAQGKYSQHKGWLCRYASETRESHEAKIQALKDRQRYIVTSPSGEQFVVDKVTFTHRLP